MKLKLFLASHLSRWAVWCRGEKWYMPDVWHGVPGNHASELESRIWQNVVILTPSSEYESETMQEIRRDLKSLGQFAGSNCGHIEPKGDL